MSSFASNLATQTSNYLYPSFAWSSNSTRFASNLAANTSNSLYPLVFSSSNKSFSASNIAAYSSNKALENSNILYPLSIFASNNAIAAKYAATYSSNSAVFCSNLVVITSNCAWFASNTAALTSNIAYISSFYNSNKSVFASNAAAYASNISYITSNLLTITSNTTWNTLTTSLTNSNIAYTANSNAYYASNTSTNTSNYVYINIPSLADSLAATSNQAYVGAITSWRYHISGTLFTMSNIAIAQSNAAFNIDVGSGSIGCSNMYVDAVAFKYKIASNTPVIPFNYDPGVLSIGSNNNPINGLIKFNQASSNLQYTIIDNNGFRAPKRGIYSLQANIGIKCRAYDAVQLVMTQCPHPLDDREQMSNIRGYTIASTETWTNYNSGVSAVSGLGYVIPERSVLSLNTIAKVNGSEYIQCFLVTHHTARSNASATLLNVQSNTPVMISDVEGYMSGVLITNMN